MEKIKHTLQIKIGPLSIASYIYLFARLYMGYIFLKAGYAKIPVLHQFEINVSHYNILPQGAIHPFSYILPWVELIVGLYLIIGLLEKLSAKVTIFLLLLFITALSYAIITQQPVSNCGCFAQNTVALVGWQDVLRDIGYLLLTIIVLLYKGTILSFDALLQRRVHEQDQNITTA